jgi:hypothetical protein
LGEKQQKKMKDNNKGNKISSLASVVSLDFCFGRWQRVALVKIAGFKEAIPASEYKRQPC